MDVCVVPILPRDLMPGPRRARAAQVNLFLQAMVPFLPQVHLLKLDFNLTTTDDVLNTELYRDDHLHLNDVGSGKLVEFISRKLNKLGFGGRVMEEWWRECSVKPADPQFSNGDKPAASGRFPLWYRSNPERGERDIGSRRAMAKAKARAGGRARAEANAQRAAANTCSLTPFN